MMPLIYATPGCEFEILKVNGLNKVQSHLKDMGFVPGSLVQLICVNNGNVICKLKDTRIAIDRDLAMKIMI